MDPLSLGIICVTIIVLALLGTIAHADHHRQNWADDEAESSVRKGRPQL